MLKLTSLERKSDLTGNMLCHPINVYKNNESKILFNQGTIFKPEDIELLEKNFNNLSEFYLLISTKDEVQQKILKEFVVNKIMELFNEEKSLLLARYPMLPEKTLLENVNNFLSITLNNLKTSYLIDLLTHPIILRKALQMGILGVFFSYQLNLSIREMEDILITCLLTDLNLCNNFSFNNIASANFDKESLFNYTKMKNSSYEIIKSDNYISNNTKRLIKYWRSNNSNDNNIKGNGIIKTEDNMIIIKDVTMEIVQLCNELLSYDTDVKSIKSLYKYPIINSLEGGLFRGIEKAKKTQIFRNKIESLLGRKKN